MAANESIDLMEFESRCEMPVEAREWMAERAVGEFNRGLVGVGLGLIRMEMEKWPIEWAGMLWEKMQQSRATAAGSSSSSEQ